MPEPSFWVSAFLGYTHHPSEGYINLITEEIRLAIGKETDVMKAGRMNVARSVSVIQSHLGVHNEETVYVCAAVYDIETGRVDFST